MNITNMDKSSLGRNQSPKTKQQKIVDFFNAPLNLTGYQVFTSGVIDVSKTNNSKFSKSHVSKGKMKSLKKSPQRTAKNKRKENARNSLDKWCTKESEQPRKSWKQFDDLTDVGGKTKKTKSQNKLLLRKESSFEKYGLHLPSADKILENKQRFLKDAEALDNLEYLYDDIDFTTPESLRGLATSSKSANSKITNIPSLHCKMLSTEELEDYFYKNLKCVRKIFKGKLYSERHEQYKNKSLRSKLIINYSTLVFSDKQLEHLIDLLGKEFDEEGEYTEYFLLVLLPELCLRIFMKYHIMSLEEASEYLEKRDCDDENMSK